MVVKGVQDHVRRCDHETLQSSDKSRVTLDIMVVNHA